MTFSLHTQSAAINGSCAAIFIVVSICIGKGHYFDLLTIGQWYFGMIDYKLGKLVSSFK